MLLFTVGQRPLLEFLRNLTPQVLLGSVAFVLHARLDMSRFDLSNWPNTFVFLSCVAFTALAFYANMSQFFDALLDSVLADNRLPRRLRRSGVPVSKVLCAFARAVGRKHRFLVFDLLASAALVNAAALSILVAAASAARNALR